MKTSVSYTLLENLADELAEQGWAVCDDFVANTLALELTAECRQRHALGLLTQAAIGRGSALAVREGVRGDAIQWLEPAQSLATDAYLTVMESLRGMFNRSLYLGLEDFESHFALYPPGAFYQKHLDRFRDDDRRVLSTVLYLNDSWCADDGGCLRLYLDEQCSVDIEPLAGRLVLFRSAQMLHEVLPVSRERLSLTGWFRRRGDGVI